MARLTMKTEIETLKGERRTIAMRGKNPREIQHKLEKLPFLSRITGELKGCTFSEYEALKEQNRDLYPNGHAHEEEPVTTARTISNGSLSAPVGDGPRTGRPEFSKATAYERPFASLWTRKHG